MLLTRIFSLQARAGIVRWLGWFALTLAVLCGWVPLASELTGVALVAAYAVPGAMVAKLAVESVRRLHDCGQRAGFGLKVAAGAFALFLWGFAELLGRGDEPGFWILQGIAAAMMAALLLRPGAHGDNVYGPPPERFVTSGARDGKAGLIVAAVILALHLWLGWTIAAAIAGYTRSVEERVRRESLNRPAPAPTDDTVFETSQNAR